MEEIQEPGGLGRVLKLLEDSYGSRSDERFEEKQEAYLSYRRSPGTSVAAYIATLKRLRQEYLKEDEGTTISDRSFAQRLLSRASLTRRERMDIFFSAGGKYQSAAIEKVLRFRCQHVHVDEKKPYAPKRPQFVSRKPDKGSGSYRRSDRRPGRTGGRHQAHVADAENPDDPEDPEDEDADEEGFEKEVLMGNLGPEDAEEWDDEDYEGWEDEEWWEDEEETYEMEDLRDAYAAGWKAKQKAAEGKKARGYHDTKGKGGGKGKGKKGGKSRPPDQRSVEDRKKRSKCSACGQYGHWHNDPECPRARSSASGAGSAGGGGSTTNFTGMASSETASQKESASGVKVSQVNWTFMMRHDDDDDEFGGWERIRDYGSEASLSESSSEYELPVGRGASAEPKAAGKSKYKVDVRKVLKALELMAEDDDTRRRLEKKEKKLAQQDLERDEKRRKKLERAQRHINNHQSTDANAQEMLMMLPHLTKDEKRHLYDALKREKEEEELRYFRPDYKKEHLRRKDERHGGYSAAKPKSRLAASSSDPPPPRESRELPEPAWKPSEESSMRAIWIGRDGCARQKLRISRRVLRMAVPIPMRSCSGVRMPMPTGRIAGSAD